MRREMEVSEVAAADAERNFTMPSAVQRQRIRRLASSLLPGRLLAIRIWLQALWRPMHRIRRTAFLRADGGPSYTSYCLSAAFGGVLLDDSPLNTLEAINGSTVQAEFEPRSNQWFNRTG